MMAGRYPIALALAWGLVAGPGCADDHKVAAHQTSEVAASKIHYAYDAVGRLIQAASDDGTGVEYSYDAVGNIAAIRRLTPAVLSVLDFAPRTGRAGSVVTIYGAGFDPAAQGDVVAFNGVPAQVTAATATTLTVAVPAGATSGRIAVTAANGSATSATNFVIARGPSTPTIAGFEPRFGTVGTVVTVTGSNFQLDPGIDKVALGGQVAEVIGGTAPDGPTATQLRFGVPSSAASAVFAASGLISITTPFGRAVSGDEFFAVPPSVSASDVEVAGRLVLNGPGLTVTTTVNAKKAVLAFDAEAGQRLHLVSHGGSFASAISATLYGPTGVAIQSFSMTNNSAADLVSVLSDGTYTVVLSPASSDRGGVVLNLNSDVLGTLRMDGDTPVSVSPGQNARFRFTAEAGKGYGLAVSALQFTPSNGSPTPTMTVTLRTLEGTELTTCSFDVSSSCNLHPPNFKTTDTYLMDFDPKGVNAATFKAVLSNDATGTTVVDAAPSGIQIARQGQNARYTFAGTAGDALQLQFTNISMGDGDPDTVSDSIVVWVLAPSNDGFPNNGPVAGAINIGDMNAFPQTKGLSPLPETGTYTILVDATGLDTGIVKVGVTHL